MKKGREKITQEITVEEILPFINGKRVLNQYLGKSFLLSIGKKKVLFGLGLGCLPSLLAKTEVGNIDYLAVSDPSLKALGDVFGFLNYRWEISRGLNIVKPIYMFGYKGLNLNIKSFSEILFGQGFDNNLGVIDWSGIEKRFSAVDDISIETFPLVDKNNVGFIIKACGKKITYLPKISLGDLVEVSSFVNNSDCLIVPECRISVEEVSGLREFKRKYSVREILTSTTNSEEYLRKYNLVSVCEDGLALKIGQFVDVPGSANALMSSIILKDNFFVKVDPRDFLPENVSFFISDRIGTSGNKYFNGERIKFCCSNEFKRSFAGKEEKNLKETDVVFGNLKDLDEIINVEKVLKPIRFFDLIYLISVGVISKKSNYSFLLVDKFGNLQLILLCYKPGEWEICDNVTPGELSEDLDNLIFISSVI